MSTFDAMAGVLTLAATSLLVQKVQASGKEIDVSRIKLFQYIQKDVDNDGQDELCFAAGIPDSILPQEVGVWLIDSVKNGETSTSTFIELASPYASGFRDLQVIDINNDSIPEILSLWQIGSGQFLSLYIYQWDGKTRSSLFPEEKSFPQGFFELKDVDADGINEIIIWEQIWAEGEKYDPKRFSIHVFRFHEHIYELDETHESERLYDPRSIVNRDIGLMGVPVHLELRTTPVKEYRQRYEHLVQCMLMGIKDTGKMQREFVAFPLHLCLNLFMAFQQKLVPLSPLALRHSEGSAVTDLRHVDSPGTSRHLLGECLCCHEGRATHLLYE